MCIGQENYCKFPTLLREKLSNKEIRFPVNTKFEYENISGYRCIQRRIDDNTPLNLDDMKSNAEMNKKLRGRSRAELKTDPKYYGVSLFKNIDILKQSLKLPRPSKKIAKGEIHMGGGPELTEGEHVCWWLYENVSFSSFKICKG